jgi:hypothetical protein
MVVDDRAREQISDDERQAQPIFGADPALAPEAPNGRRHFG